MNELATITKIDDHTLDAAGYFKGRVNLLETWMKHEMPAELLVSCPVNHHFSDGLYTRELLIPQGTVVLGKVHRKRTLNILATGKMLIMADGMEEPVLMEAPRTFVTEAGVQKVGVAIADSVWINVFPTEETDLETIEEAIYFPETVSVGETGLPDKIETFGNVEVL